MPTDPNYVRKTRRRPNALGQWRRAATVLIEEITATAERIAAARDARSNRIGRAKARQSLLGAIERARGCPSISDLARALRISRQATQRLVTSAARAGEVALCTNPDDRRILQAELTALGRASLASALLGDAVWVITLLSGLETREMQRVAHVLQVIRLRLTRYYR